MFWYFQVESLRAWKRKLEIFIDLEISGVSGFSFWGIEPIQKMEMTENVNLISVPNICQGWYFCEPELILKVDNFQKVESGHIFL